MEEIQSHSYEICSSYKDKRIKLIKQENAGVGAARNTGLENILGQKIVFIDADDYINPTYLADLLKYRDYDLVVQGYATCSENGNVLKKVIPEELIVNKEKFGDHSYCSSSFFVCFTNCFIPNNDATYI